jgi:hypothetical protein
MCDLCEGSLKKGAHLRPGRVRSVDLEDLLELVLVRLATVLKRENAQGVGGDDLHELQLTTRASYIPHQALKHTYLLEWACL